MNIGGRRLDTGEALLSEGHALRLPGLDPPAFENSGDGGYLFDSRGTVRAYDIAQGSGSSGRSPRA